MKLLLFYSWETSDCREKEELETQRIYAIRCFRAHQRIVGV